MQFENFLRFQILDAHNASFLSNMFWKELPQSDTKVRKIRDLPFEHHGFF
jgi:hypothetical protein